jgi:lysine 6-dehydrogenase
MKSLVIGAGMMGSAMAYDLVHSESVAEVLLADVSYERAEAVALSLGEKVHPLKLDVHYYDDVVYVMSTVDVAFGATSYTHNHLLARAAIEAGVHFCDLGGNMDVVDRQLLLGMRAKEAGVCVIPNCGLAPGMACVIAAGAAKKFEHVDEIHIRVGGLPQHPQPPLNYQLVFSAEGLINEYLEPAEAIRDGRIQKVESMTECEELEFPPPFGKLEAFHTSGGISTLTRMFDGKARNIDYKTIRYRGHCEKFKTLLELGFASAEPIIVGNSASTVREFFENLLRKKLTSNGPDVVLMRVTVSGTMDDRKRTLAYEMTDYYDTSLNMTSMMRTTAFPTSIIGQMVVSGTIAAHGVFPPEQCVPMEPFLAELRKRNIIVKESLVG